MRDTIVFSQKRFIILGCSSSEERSVRDREARGSIPRTPTPQAAFVCLSIMKRKEFIRLVLVRSLGNFLLLFSLYGVVLTFGPVMYYELQYRIIAARGVTFIPAVDKTQKSQNNNSSSPSFAAILAGSKAQMLMPIDTSFSIMIPKIAANAKVFANVDPSSSQEYLPILQKGIAHTKGSVFPGMNGNIYLFAHSADNWWDAGRYNAVFYLLKNLLPGDEIVIFFENDRYNYIVTGSMIKPANDTSFLVADHTKPEQLVLQTCWPPGTNWERLYILAKPRRI
jgi:LPXTG-site transpeptidase (sortase) family protein